MMKLVVLTCLVAAASAALVAPLSPYVYGASYLAPTNYRGPLSLAPGQPANILAADGRPLDTLDVNLDRSAHFVSKAFNGIHYLKKRSLLAPRVAGLAAPLAYTHAPLVAPYGLTHYGGYGGIAPLAHYTAPIVSHW